MFVTNLARRTRSIGLVSQFFTTKITSKQRTEFLKNRHIYEYKGLSFCKREFNLINYPQKAVNRHETAHYKACQDRLNRLLKSSGDFTQETIPNNVQTFGQFCILEPTWGDPESSYVFFRDHTTVKLKESVLRQRAQSYTYGLCYIHGPDVLQHYLVSMNSEARVGMIDITKFIRDSFSSKQLEDYIFRDEGGSSFETLSQMLLPDSIIAVEGIELSASRLRTFGPALVSFFRVHDDFTVQTRVVIMVDPQEASSVCTQWFWSATAKTPVVPIVTYCKTGGSRNSSWKWMQNIS